MDQDGIWAHYQTKRATLFEENEGRLLALLNKLPPKCTVLDIGVGNGYFEERALERGHTVWGVDPSTETVERLRERHPSLKEQLHVGRIEALPFKEGFFDAVVVSEVLEHLPLPIAQKGLQEIVRVLKPQGILLGSVPAYENLDADVVVCPSCNGSFHRWGHVESFTPEKVMQMLHDVQFTVVSCKVRKCIPHHRRRGVAKGVGYLRALLPYIGIRQDDETLLFSGHKK